MEIEYILYDTDENLIKLLKIELINLLSLMDGLHFDTLNQEYRDDFGTGNVIKALEELEIEKKIERKLCHNKFLYFFIK